MNKQISIFKLFGGFLLTLIGSWSVWAQSPSNFTASGTWTCPAGVTLVTVEVYGAGGGAGAGGGSNGDGGGGGAGGGFATRANIAVTCGTVYNITIGAGGTGGINGGAAATSGGTSSAVFGAVTVSATGGSFGASFAAGSAGGATGGAGVGGTTNRTGGIGGNGSGTNSGGGGGCAGTTGNGGNGIADAWGAGGGGMAGDGGDGTTFNTANGVAGFDYGGGGGSGTKNTNGRAGANGYISISYTCPASPTVNAGSDISTAACVTTATLAGSAVPACMTGSWSVISGSATVTTPSSPTSGVTALSPGGAATLRWTITNPGCGTFTDDVIINASAGPGCVAYIHPTVGINGEFVGTCLVTTTGGAYYDDGGAAGNYSLNIGTALNGGIYRVFCPTNAGQCMSVNFSAFSTETTADYMTIGNGPTQNSAFFVTAPANASGRISGTPAVPFSYTSSHASGCLTFRFRSDVSIVSSGWAAVLSSVACAGGPTGTDNSDCVRAIPTCVDVVNPANAVGPGIDAEGCTGSTCPAGGENHADWYKVKFATAGTFDYSIIPSTGSDDYDYTLFRNATCAQIATGVGAGAPIRCSDSALTGTTGSQSGAGDNTEPASGNKFTDPIAVAAGDEIYILVDEWTPTGAGFTLDFTLSGGATFDCTILPVELTNFDVTYNGDEYAAQLYWSTESERNNDYYIIEKSTDGENFTEIGKVDGAGNTSSRTEYYAYDPQVAHGVSYYRLKQVDFNGKFNYSELRTLNFLQDEDDILNVFPNPTTGTTEIVFNSYKKEKSIIKIMDMSGKELMNQEVDCNIGGNFYQLEMNDYADGIYYITITTSSKVYSEKIIKSEEK